MIRLSIALALPALAAAASAQNLVNNPGFETRDFSGWTVTRASSGSQLYIIPNLPHSGDWYAEFGATNNLPDTLSQTIATVPGQKYSVSCWVRNTALGRGDYGQSFTASFAGGSVTLLNPFVLGYGFYTFDAVATSTSTTLSLAGYNLPDFYNVDDMSVQAVPEPSALAALGLGALALLRRRKA